MTKTLTEQWREGTLRGCFYWKLPNGNICTAYTDTMRDIKNVRDSDEVEVLEETPSYVEYQDIIQQNVNQEAAIETYIEDIKRLQEQLNDANEVIKYIKQKTESNYDNKEKVDVISTKAFCYLARWGIR